MSGEPETQDASVGVPEASETVEATNAAPAEAPTDPLARLQLEAAEARAAVVEWKDRFLRKAAELENYRKRVQKEKAEAAIAAQSVVVAEILNVVDAFDRAIRSFLQSEAGEATLEQYREGIGLLHRQLLDALARVGVVPIETAGQKFDPHLHEAILHEVNPEYSENTVTSELRRGYLFGDRLLRPAQVTVAVSPDGEEKGEGSLSSPPG